MKIQQIDITVLIAKYYHSPSLCYYLILDYCTLTKITDCKICVPLTLYNIIMIKGY